MRLDKYLSHCTQLSRKNCRREIKAGLVQVNGHSVIDPAHLVNSTDTVTHNSQVLSLPQPRYFMVYKPLAVVSASADPDHPCVTDLLHNEAPGLQVAGRLDKDATGLVLLSDDGDWIHQVISPNKHCIKTYRVEICGNLSEDAREKFTQGMQLKGENKPTRPATLEQLNKSTYKIHISEGRYHQVKRMFAACGAQVIKLHREQIGAICLDQNLAEGEYRPLTTLEIDSVSQ